MPAPKTPDVTKMTEAQAISYIKSETNLSVLGRLAQGEKREKIISAIQDRSSELAE
jgi:hypothetical protein